MSTLINSTSLDPKSLSIASLIDRLHPKGPGVKSFLSNNERVTFLFYNLIDNKIPDLDIVLACKNKIKCTFKLIFELVLT